MGIRIGPASPQWQQIDQEPTPKMSGMRLLLVMMAQKHLRQKLIPEIYRTSNLVITSQKTHRMLLMQTIWADQSKVTMTRRLLQTKDRKVSTKRL